MLDGVAARLTPVKRATSDIISSSVKTAMVEITFEVFIPLPRRT